jgi:hypothetical protein
MGGILIGQILLQLGDLTLQILHVNTFESLQTVFCSLQLTAQIVILSFDCADAPAVFIKDQVDDLLRQRLFPDLDILQEFAFHITSFLRFALLSLVASAAVGVFAPATAKMV